MMPGVDRSRHSLVHLLLIHDQSTAKGLAEFFTEASEYFSRISSLLSDMGGD